MPADRSGTALLEVLIALVVLSIATASSFAVRAQEASALEQAKRVDLEMRDASRFMDAVSLWPVEDLDRHLGTRSEGRWRLTIYRSASTLYDVTLSDSSGAQVVLWTALHRTRASYAQ